MRPHPPGPEAREPRGSGVGAKAGCPPAGDAGFFSQKPVGISVLASYLTSVV